MSVRWLRNTLGATLMSSVTALAVYLLSVHSASTTTTVIADRQTTHDAGTPASHRRTYSHEWKRYFLNFLRLLGSKKFYSFLKSFKRFVLGFNVAYKEDGVQISRPGKKILCSTHRFC